MVISPPVTSPQPKVSSLHNRSHFAPYRSYLTPCKKLVKFVGNFLFWCWSWTDFQLTSVQIINWYSFQSRSLTFGNTKYHFVRLLSSTLIFMRCNPSKTLLIHGGNTWSVLVNYCHYWPSNFAYSIEMTFGKCHLTFTVRDWLHWSHWRCWTIQS